jgi:hypothetical protein
MRSVKNAHTNTTHPVRHDRDATTVFRAARRDRTTVLAVSGPPVGHRPRSARERSARRAAPAAGPLGGPPARGAGVAHAGAHDCADICRRRADTCRHRADTWLVLAFTQLSPGHCAGASPIRLVAPGTNRRPRTRTGGPNPGRPAGRTPSSAPAVVAAVSARVRRDDTAVETAPPVTRRRVGTVARSTPRRPWTASRACRASCICAATAVVCRCRSP